VDKALASTKRCNFCNSSQLKSIFDFGYQPLANSLLSSRDLKNELKYELNLLICKKCRLVQLSEQVDPSLMFTEYKWVTGTSQSTKIHCNNIYKLVIQNIIKKQNKILEIGSNDGTLLHNFISSQFNLILGIDPASNFQQFYVPPINFINDFFDANSATSILNDFGVFEVIIARNVFSHIPNPRSVFKGISLLLAEDGIFYIEFHWLKKILTEVHYDSIYHEHTFYHSISSVSKYLAEFHLYPVDAWESPISGGSIILSFQRTLKEKSKTLNKLIDDEIVSGIEDFKSWENFALATQQNISELSKYLEDNSNKNIYGFGVSARSSTILNSIGKNANYINAMADNNSLKWGMWTPGIHLRVMSPEEAINNFPQIFIIFPFNFENEIIMQLKNLGWAGEIAVPLPNKLRVFSI
jgi:SAM-dependent methyltransferase